MDYVAHFLNDEDGAVTVDWVVLTAAIVGMGVFVISTVASGALDTSSGVGAAVADVDIGVASGSGDGDQS